MPHNAFCRRARSTRRCCMTLCSSTWLILHLVLLGLRLTSAVTGIGGIMAVLIRAAGTAKRQATKPVLSNHQYQSLSTGWIKGLTLVRTSMTVARVEVVGRIIDVLMTGFRTSQFHVLHLAGRNPNHGDGEALNGWRGSKKWR